MTKPSQTDRHRAREPETGLWQSTNELSDADFVYVLRRDCDFRLAKDCRPSVQGVLVILYRTFDGIFIHRVDLRLGGAKRGERVKSFGLYSVIN